MYFPRVNRLGLASGPTVAATREYTRVPYSVVECEGRRVMWAVHWYRRDGLACTMDHYMDALA
jgi:hypothetical protein